MYIDFIYGQHLKWIKLKTKSYLFMSQDYFSDPLLFIYI